MAVGEINIIRKPRSFQARLTASSGNPYITSDLSAQSTLYLTPFDGDILSLYTGSAWRDHILSEISIALSGLTPFRDYDVFCYSNSGTPTLELLGWTAPSSGSITGATNATPIVITSTAHGRATNDLVYISGVGGNTAANSATGVPFRITVLTANTFSLQTLAGANVAGSGAYTSGGTWFRADQTTARATSLAWQNGTYVKSGDATRRYCGTIRTSSASTTESTITKRFIWNYYNQQRLRMYTFDATSHSYNGGQRAWNNDYGLRLQFVLGNTAALTMIASGQCTPGATTSIAAHGPGIDSISNYGIDAWVVGDVAGRSLNAPLVITVGAGAHYVQAIENTASTGSATFTAELIYLELPC